MATTLPPLPQGYKVVNTPSLPPLPKGYSVVNEQPKPEEQPGFVKRFAQSWGVPTSVEEMKAMSPKSFTDVLLSHPAATMAKGYVGQVGNALSEAKQEVTDAADVYASGKKGEAVKRAFGAGAYAGFKMIPGLGPVFSQSGEDVANKNYSGAVGGFLAGATQLALPAKLKSGRTVGEVATEALVKKPAEVLTRGTKTGIQAGRSLVDPTMITADNAFIKAVKPKNSISGVREKVNSALPEIKRVADEAGIDFANVPDEMLHSVADDVAKKAAQQTWEQIASRLEANGLKTMSTQGIAEAIANRVQGMTEIALKENRGAVTKMLQKVEHYAQGEISVSRMEARIQELNNKLKGQQNVLKVDEGTLRRNPRYAADFIELDTLRKMQDGILEAAGDSVRSLKRQYGALKEVRSMIERNANVAERASAEPLFQGLGRLAGTGNTVGGAWEFVTGHPRQGLSNMARGAAQMAIGRKASLMNNRNFLLRQALMKAKPSARMADVIAPKVSEVLPPASPKALGAAVETKPTAPIREPWQKTREEITGKDPKVDDFARGWNEEEFFRSPMEPYKMSDVIHRSKPRKMYWGGETRNVSHEFAAALDKHNKRRSLLMERPIDADSGAALSEWSPVGEYEGGNLGIAEAYRGKGAGTAFEEWLLRSGRRKGPSIGYSPEGLATVTKAHKRIIEKALAEGKPVPKAVLDSYPELKK